MPENAQVRGPGPVWIIPQQRQLKTTYSLHLFSRPAVSRHDVLHVQLAGLVFRALVPREDSFYYLGYPEELKVSVQKHGYRFFVTRVQNGRIRPPVLKRLSRQGETRKFRKVRPFKREVFDLQQVQALHHALRPLRKGERKLYGELHVRHRELRQDRPVNELYQRVDYGLGMHDDFYA